MKKLLILSMLLIASEVKGQEKPTSRDIFFPVNQSDTAWRYFYITYIAQNEKGQMVWGDLYRQTTAYPTLNELRQIVKSFDNNFQDIQISITEMKPDDFKRFITGIKLK